MERAEVFLLYNQECQQAGRIPLQLVPFSLALNKGLGTFVMRKERTGRMLLAFYCHLKRRF